MKLKRGDVPPLSGDLLKLAEEFQDRWYGRYRERYEAKRREQVARHLFATVARDWLEREIRRQVKNPRNIERALRKDILPIIGSKRVSEVTANNVLKIVENIKNRGFEQMALQT